MTEVIFSGTGNIAGLIHRMSLIGVLGKLMVMHNSAIPSLTDMGYYHHQILVARVRMIRNEDPNALLNDR